MRYRTMSRRQLIGTGLITGFSIVLASCGGSGSSSTAPTEATVSGLPNVGASGSGSSTSAVASSSASSGASSSASSGASSSASSGASSSSSSEDTRTATRSGP